MPLPDVPDTPLLIDESNSITGGFISNAEPHLLQSNQSAYILNIRPTIDGRRQKIKGLDPIANIGASHSHGLFAFEAPLQGRRDLVAFQTGRILSISAVGNPTDRTGSADLRLQHHTAVVGRAGGKTTLFATNCVNASNVSLPWGAMHSWDYSYNYTNPAASTTAVRVRAIAWSQGRLWGWNSCNTVAGQDYLIWSAPLDGNNFDNGQNVQVDPDTGDEGTAIIPLRDQTPRMVLFKKRSAWLFEFYWATDGYYTVLANALDTTKSSVRPLTLETGCIATRGAVWAPGAAGTDVLFLSYEGIRSLNRSLTDSQAGAGLPLSYRIQPIIDRINWAYADRSIASFWDGVAHFAVPLDGSTFNNFLISYDTLRDAFYLSDWQINGMAAADLSTGTRKFYFLGGGATTVTEVYSSAATLGFHVYETGVGAKGPGQQPIDMDEHTRAYTFDLEGPASGLKYRKRWSWLDIVAQAAATHSTLTISYKIDDDPDWTSFRHIGIAPADAYPYLPEQLPFGFSSSKLVHHKLSLDTLRPGYKLQFRLRDNTSFAQMKIQQLALAAYPKPVTFS